MAVFNNLCKTDNAPSLDVLLSVEAKRGKRWTLPCFLVLLIFIITDCLHGALSDASLVAAPGSVTV